MNSRNYRLAHPLPVVPQPRVPFANLGAMTAEIRAEVNAGWGRILDTSAFIGGVAVETFEEAWATYCGTTECVGVGNGTDALQLALMALGIGAGDEVIVPGNTFIATAEAVVLAGATPRFADVSPDTLLLTAETVQAAITPRTKAVIVVHLYGQVADMDSIMAVTSRAGLALIEDAAQAHGATWSGNRAGSFGHAGCFSFYPGKNLGAFGDAGAVVTSDVLLASRIRSLRDHGRVAGSHYEHDLVGMNSRLDGLQAVVLTAKLSRLEAWTAARIAVADRYREAMEGTVLRLVGNHAEARGVYHLAVARVPNREQARKMLDSLGIDSSIHYPTPCHQHVPYRRFAAEALPVVDKAAEEIVSLTMFPHLTEAQITRVCDAIAVVDELLSAREPARA
jgi:dTDP-4-amino-4,6-dideoxygalactose transaminase